MSACDSCQACGHRRTVHDGMTPPGGRCYSSQKGGCDCRAWVAPDGYFLHLLDEPTYIRVEREKPSLWRRWRTSRTAASAPSQTSTEVDDLPDERTSLPTAQSAATDGSRAADATGPYPSSAIPSDGA